MIPTHQEMIDRLGSSAEMLKLAVAAAPSDRLTQRPREGEWSVLEVLTHVRDAVMIAYSSRIRRMLIEDDLRFVNYDLDAYAQANPTLESAADVLQMIVTEHEQIARMLSALPDARWERQGIHPQLGPISIEWYARQVSAHAEEHAAQITNTINAMG